MIRALYTAASGMNAQQTNIDNTAHNLANVNTAGFKKARVEFEDLVYQQVRGAGTPNSTSTEDADRPRDRPRHARRRHRARLRHRQPETTNGPLDLAIEGQRLLPGDAAGRPHRLHARRRVPPERRGRHRHRRGLSARAADHDPGRRDVDQHLEGRRRLGDHRRPERGAAGRHDRAGHVPEPAGAAAARRQLLRGDHRVGRADDRRAGHGRPRHARSRASSRSRTSASSRR